MGVIIESLYHRTVEDHYKSNEAEPVIGSRIKISQSIRKSYIAKGAFKSILRDDRANHMISGLIRVQGLRNVFYGDYHGETIGVRISNDSATLIVTLFKGHIPKRRKTRSRKVQNHIHNCTK